MLGGAAMNSVILDGEVMFCDGGRLSVHFLNGCIEVIGNRKRLKMGERVRIEGRLVSKISRTAIFQKIYADEVMRL